MQLTAYCKGLRLPLRKPFFKCPKCWLGMKLTAILLLVSVLQVSAGGFAQTITLHMKNAPLEKVLTEIKKQSGYYVIYGKGQMEKAHPVNVDITGGTLENALFIIFNNQPVSFSIKDKFIVVSPKITDQLSAPVPGPVKPGDLQGIVKDEKGNVLAGISVRVKGTLTTTTTNSKGEFLLKDIQEGAILIFYGVNIETTEIRSDGKPLTVTLTIRVDELDLVKIIGYGTTTRRLSTGNSYTVTNEDISKQPVSNPLQALSGRMPGVFVTETSGTPGAGITVQIRGIGSLLSGTNPLYIIDGVPFLSEPIYTAGGNTNSSLKTAYSSSPLNAINPADIESIDVLKDADATAIYGSRGSNGVILITTKKGKPGKTKVDVNISHGFTGVSDLHRVKPLSLAQYLEIRRAAFANSGATPTTALAPDLLVWDTTDHETADFEKVLIGRTAHVTDASTGFSGGNQQTNFLLSGTFHRETAIVPGDNYYTRGAIHFAVEHTSLNKKFSASISSSLVWDKGSNIGRVFQSSDLAGYAFTLIPNFPLYDSTGKNLYWYNNSNQNYDNPLKYQNQVYTTKNNNLIGGIVLKYTPITGLNLKLNTSYNKITTNSQNLVYSKGINPYTTTLPSAYFQQNTSEIWNVEPQADYTHNISKGRMNILAGATFQGNTFNQPYYLVGTGYTSDALLANPQAAGTTSLFTFFSEYKYQSFFGRLNYNWLNKYILNVNYRWDASSKFGINNRYGSFASVGGAWIFSEEDIIKNKQNILSYGKLRASYGSTGNDQIGNYQYMDTYSTTSYAYNSVSSLIPSRIANPDLKWEVNKKLEVATDLGFFKDRILISAAWFRNKTANPLVLAPLSTVTGFASYSANLNAVIQQQGTEFTFTSKNIQTRNFNWTTSFNITFADSKLISFPGIENTSYYYNRVVGTSMSAVYGFKYTGLDATTNLPTFLDANKSGANLYSETYPVENAGLGDYVNLGKTNPDYYGGLNNSFKYKGFQLDVFVQFVGHVMRKGIASLSTAAPGYNAVNMYSGAYDLFKETNGKIATRTFSYTEGSPYLSFIKYLQSDAVMSDGAYARLKNVSFSYTFNDKWVSKIKMAAAQVYVRGQNLFTVTKFQGLDPETGTSFIPPLRTITAGVKFSF